MISKIKLITLRLKRQIPQQSGIEVKVATVEIEIELKGHDFKIKVKVTFILISKYTRISFFRKRIFFGSEKNHYIVI